MAVDFPDEFDSEVATDPRKPVKSMTDKEYEAFKKQRDCVKGGIMQEWLRPHLYVKKPLPFRVVFGSSLLTPLLICVFQNQVLHRKFYPVLLNNI